MDNLVQFKADEETKKSSVGLKFPTLSLIDQPSSQTSNNVAPICYTGGNSNVPQKEI